MLPQQKNLPRAQCAPPPAMANRFDDFQPLTIIIKCSILEAATVLDPPLHSPLLFLHQYLSVHLFYQVKTTKQKAM